MILYVLFVQFGNQKTPKAVTVLDEATVSASSYTVKEYQDLVLEQSKSAFEEEATEWGWFEVHLQSTTRRRIIEELNDITPTFASQRVEAVPKEQTHPSIEGITVTVGRIPGKIVDDEIR